MKYSKILIVGDSGRGKTTLANKLADKLEIKKYSTDDLFWEVKYTKPRDKAISIDIVTELCKKEKWIIEGSTKHLIAPGLESADLILLMRFKTIFHQWFFISKRHFVQRHKTESLKTFFILLRHVYYRRFNLGYKKGSVTLEKFIEQYDKKVILITSFKQVHEILELYS